MRQLTNSCLFVESLRYKQPAYPILFLTRGKCRPFIAKEPLKDPRMTGVENASYFAASIDLAGVNPHASDILHDRSLVQFIKMRCNLALFVWDGTLTPADIKKLRDMNVNGI